MTMTDRHELVTADPVGLTQRELLLRLDAKLDRHEDRIRRLEDGALVSSTERKTIRALIVAALSAWPVVGYILVNYH